MMRTIRPIILSVSLVIAVTIFLVVQNVIDSPTLLRIRLAESYALTALAFLYLTLTVSPLILLFPQMRGRALLVRSRRALGVSTAFFATLHASIEFFSLLGGFAGLSYLSPKYLIAITLSATAYLILLILVATSLEPVYRALGRAWKPLNRIVYLAAVFIMIHAVILGTHFSDLSRPFPRLVFVAVFALLFVEAIRFDRFIRQRWATLPVVGPSAVFSLCLAIGFFVALASPSSSLNTLGVHSQHIALVQEQQQAPRLPGVTGDTTRRFSVGFASSAKPQAQKPVGLTFTVTDANTGSPVSLFGVVYEKVAHLIVVDESLQYFSHIHPQQEGSQFVMTTTFPHEGSYRLYLDFTPLGAIEQQFTFRLQVGDGAGPSVAAELPDSDQEKPVGPWRVSLNTNGLLRASALSLGQQRLTFSFKDAATGEPASNIHPYLAAFGHLVMVNQSTLTSTHVHTTTLTPPKADETAGPTVEFLPLALYGPITAGNYKLFAQFSDGREVYVVPFVVAVE